MKPHQRTKVRTTLNRHNPDGTITSKVVSMDASFCSNGKTRKVLADKGYNYRNLDSVTIRVEQLYLVEWIELTAKCPFPTMSEQQWIEHCKANYNGKGTEVKSGVFMHKESFAKKNVISVTELHTGEHQILD